ncbi:MAG: hypothetical protein IPM26_06855 [Saprospiraceae bacterium]|jgi:hypothetical protein|nr:hypothetical protein [Saprospiraceae bacterium]
MYLLKSLPFYVFILLVSCKQPVEKLATEEDPLYLEVMEIHDAVMPEMSTIHSLKRELKAITLSDETRRTLVQNELKKLDDADEAMMSWMAAFAPPDEQAQRTKYLETEKQKIQAVSDEMWAAINSAKVLLDSLQNNSPKN